MLRYADDATSQFLPIQQFNSLFSVLAAEILDKPAAIPAWI
jgi:hypothetical protein